MKTFISDGAAAMLDKILGQKYDYPTSEEWDLPDGPPEADSHVLITYKDTGDMVRGMRARGWYTTGVKLSACVHCKTNNRVVTFIKNGHTMKACHCTLSHT